MQSSGTIIGYEVVYNLMQAGEDLYLPEAYVVSRDRDGLLAHIQQKALPETIGSFGLTLDEPRRQLFAIIDELQPKNLEQRFSPPRRKAKSLEALLADADAKKSIYQFAHRRLDVFLSLLVRHGLPLTWQVERKVLVKDFLVRLSDKPLQPHLYFERTGQGVRYRLRLGQHDHFWRISSREVIPIANRPAWLLVDDRLCRVDHLNGFLVKPFQRKNEIVIPKATVKDYFKKFIIKIAAKVDIEAEGFEVIQHEELMECRLEAVNDLFTGRWMLLPRMGYRGALFHWNDVKSQRTILEIDADEIRIVRVRRHPKAEAERLRRLERFGLAAQDGAAYYFPVEENVEENPAAVLEWLARHRPDLEAAGFNVFDAQVDGMELYLHGASLQLDASPQNDWFDLHGMVRVGEFSFPFLNLAANIRQDNRYYRLPNGQYFVIPLEWMNKYKSLFQFARKEGGQLRLEKSQFTLLEELNLDGARQVAQDLEDEEFHISQRLNATLRPYQLEGVRWLARLYRNQLGACLADDMGLGKTLQTIAVLLHAKERQSAGGAETASVNGQLELFYSANDAEILRPLNALVIMPASLVYNWEEEIRQFAPSLSVYRHVGPRRYKDPRLLARFDVALTTYQTALRDAELLGQLRFEYIVLDESQQIKNRESKIFKAINALDGKHKLSLSGTPIENSLSDLWSQMQFINPNLLGSYPFFRREFITSIEKRDDEEKKKRLRQLVAPYLLRRTKEEVASELPPLSSKVFYSEMTPEQRRVYDREKSAARNYLLENFQTNDPKYRMMVLRSLTKLRQLANHPRLALPNYERESGKFQDILAHWEVIRKSHHKALFFSSFVRYLELFRAEFEASRQAYAWLSGELDAQERERQIRRFESEADVQSFLVSIKSGGVGLNLTAADYVFILDPWWNPTTEQQAIARAHRIGQDKHVMAIKFITKDSIEEKILRLQERKSKLAKDIIEHTRPGDFSLGELEYLFE
jgi:superfamily II DNA or RNA helicase